MDELKVIQVYADGRTDPEIPSGSPIVLIQDGAAEVGRLNLGKEYIFGSEIEHPKNSSELTAAVSDWIRNIKPEFLRSESSIIVRCPVEIAELMVW